jgi:large subunit ribosomal protein L5
MAIAKTPPTGSDTSRLLAKYKTEIVPGLMKKFNKTNVHSVPKLQKIVLNMGVGKALQDKEKMKTAAEWMGLIAGQRPQITKAKQAISTFRLRQGYEIGCRRDPARQADVRVPGSSDPDWPCRGSATSGASTPRAFDGNGNYSMGVSEQLIFPEIDPDKVNLHAGDGHHVRDQHPQRRRSPRDCCECLRHAVPRGVRGRVIVSVADVELDKCWAEVITQ